MPNYWGYEVAQLIEMPREDLGIAILQGIEHDSLSPTNEAGLASEDLRRAGATADQVRELALRIAAACKWLEREGYVVPDPHGSGDWMRVTKEGTEAAAASTAPSRVLTLLDAFSIHPRLANAKKDFHAGRLDDAVTGAVKAVETGVRDASGARRSLLGLDLMKAVFMPEGLLADPRVDKAENIGRAMMYQGFIGWWRNRAAHHTWPSSDPQPVSEILLTADYLLRTADTAAADKAAGWPEEPSIPT